MDNFIIENQIMENIEANYTGLFNQGNTCYLNTVLQTLFMTPEFRNLIYSCEYVNNENSVLIFQLQTLFFDLQTTNKNAISTVSFTNNLGWDSSDLTVQQDVQEVFSKLYNTIREELQNKFQNEIMSNLFEGQIVSYVKCLKCNSETCNESNFLEISLPIRNANSNAESYKSIEDALEGFFESEVLLGQDKYYCNSCSEKTVALKGFKFIKFPYLFIIHLKRFEFDYEINQRIKINDKVTFPDILDVTPYLQSGKEWNIPENVGTETEELGQYELFSIINHSGTATIGHYYAYIKDLSKNIWLSYNDHNVAPIASSDIARMYGQNTANANAYMLVYRQIDASRNELAAKIMTIPSDIDVCTEEFIEDEEINATQEAIEEFPEPELVNSFLITPVKTQGKISRESFPDVNMLSEHVKKKFHLFDAKNKNNTNSALKFSQASAASRQMESLTQESVLSNILTPVEYSALKSCDQVAQESSIISSDSNHLDDSAISFISTAQISISSISQNEDTNSIINCDAKSKISSCTSRSRKIRKGRLSNHEINSTSPMHNHLSHFANIKPPISFWENKTIYLVFGHLKRPISKVVEKNIVMSAQNIIKLLP